MKQNIQILAIETSCDETAVAVIGVANENSKFETLPCRQAGRNSKQKWNNYPVILSNVVSSQADLHAKTGGVVPEVASRAHMEAIVPVISEALISASQKISNFKFLISNQFLNSNDLSIKNSSLNKNLKLINKNYSEAIKVLQNDITHIAVTAGPGLIGSLLVGFNAAKTIAYALDKPIIAVNHIEGHIYSAFAEQDTITKKQETNKFQSTNLKSQKDKLITDNCELTTEIKFPILALTVSGGHTSLTLMIDHCTYETIGETLDDAAGEAFDKVAKLLGLGYPGGPVVSRMAEEYRNKQERKANKTDSEKSVSGSYGLLSIPDRKAVVFPRPIMNDGTFNFSFSGLKTAVLQHVLNIKQERKLTATDKKEICAAFEDAAVDVLTTKAMRAIEKYKPKTLVLAGGVAANKHLREVLKYKVSSIKYHGGDKPQLLIPPIDMCGDNAAMIGIAAFYHLQKGEISMWQEVKVDSNLELGSGS